MAVIIFVSQKVKVSQTNDVGILFTWAGIFISRSHFVTMLYQHLLSGAKPLLYYYY